MQSLLSKHHTNSQWKQPHKNKEPHNCINLKIQSLLNSITQPHNCIDWENAIAGRKRQALSSSITQSDKENNPITINHLTIA